MFPSPRSAPICFFLDSHNREMLHKPWGTRTPLNHQACLNQDFQSHME